MPATPVVARVRSGCARPRSLFSGVSILTPRLRLTIVALLLLAGAWLVARLGQPAGWLLLYGAGVVAWNYWRVGTVWLAFAAYRRNDLERVRALLEQVRRPDVLRFRPRVYYHWLTGMMLAAQHRVSDAQRALARVPVSALRNDADRGALLCQLADLSLQLNDPAEARALVERARALGPTPILARAIAALDDRLAVLRRE